jgi:hypothetical protein
MTPDLWSAYVHIQEAKTDMYSGLTLLPSGKRIGRICSGLRARHVGKVAK